MEFSADFTSRWHGGLGSMPTPSGFGGMPGFGTTPTTTGATGQQPEYQHVGSDAQDGSGRPKGPWKRYGKRYLLLQEFACRSKEPQARLNDLRDYLAGRTAELDWFFAWIEQQ